ncbi:hypothetical protein Glo7428_4500 [Gloeocapsa sp. PCC 7428]|uniref:hypothetical protein n=1 Tax=Gloeocapsa sp. PCC 7428 TaxID=1173026 RepID=UPI0002A5DE2C|nr:hypothetical protein [Gloeocapsa sp. PCC 7428]AFZ32940.1 hypothetical protein Glo7428_4500 [Gloeocapsa sp. PCC 7428]
MSNEQEQVLPEDPREAEPGRGAPGDNHYGVQMAQTIDVNPPDAVIPSNTDTEESVHQVEALAEQEEGTGLPTTDGYVVDESGRLDNFAVEPPMYYEDEK